MSTSVRARTGPAQWLGRGATSAAGYQLVGNIRKYQGGWQPPAGYLPYVLKNQAEYGHHLVVMPKNEAHGQVGQIQPGTPGVGQHMVEREKKQKPFGHSTQNVIQEGENTEVQPTIKCIMQNYN